jgi:glycosyltransferase involved in cell wall biosynthesis
MKIGIIGTRGIPNHYGGFEQITGELSVGLVELGHEVTVYNTHNHPYEYDEYEGVRIVHCHEPAWMGTAGQFVYDLNCIRHARKEGFDILLFMGYTSSSVWAPFFPKGSVIISNMDGLEWKRSKYSKPVQRFLRWAEKLAVKHSHFHIADSKAIQTYLDSSYGISSHYIPYGAAEYEGSDVAVVRRYGLEPGNYFMLMARMEPENHIQMVLDGFSKSGSGKKFLVVGNTGNGYGRKMLRRYSADGRIRFAGAIFDQDVVHALRHHSLLYFHGHSVGGTNPSLLEAMSGRALVAAHRNEFNKAVLGSDAFYFSTADEVRQLAETVRRAEKEKRMIENNFHKITDQFNWPEVIRQYDEFLCECYKTAKHGEAILQG